MRTNGDTGNEECTLVQLNGPLPMDADGLQSCVMSDNRDAYVAECIMCVLTGYDTIMRQGPRGCADGRCNLHVGCRSRMVGIVSTIGWESFLPGFSSRP